MRCSLKEALPSREGFVFPNRDGSVFRRVKEYEKLVFENAHSKNAVIANQSADWCGNPPVERNQVTITTKNRRNPPFWLLIGTFPL